MVSFIVNTPPPPKPEEIRCVEILKSGKRKGDVCGSCKCMIGMNMCKNTNQLNQLIKNQ